MNTNGFILGLVIGLVVVLGSALWFEMKLEMEHENEMLMHKVILEKHLEIDMLKESLAEEQDATRLWMGYSEGCADLDERDMKYEKRLDGMLALCRESVREGCDF